MCFPGCLITADPGKFYYGVRIVTGSQAGAGSSNTDIYITLTGSKASTGKVGISGWLKVLKGDFKRRTFDDLVIESEDDLGHVLVVTIGNDRERLLEMASPWYVDFTVVHDFQTSLNEQFPVYYWIGDGDYVTCTAHTSEFIVVICVASFRLTLTLLTGSGSRNARESFLFFTLKSFDQ